MSPRQALADAAKTGDIMGVRKAIADGADPKAFRSLFLSLAAQNGHVECVNELIPLTDPKADASAALQLAAIEGYIECVRLLIPVSDAATAITRLETAVANNEGALRAGKALALLNSVIQEEALNAKHLKPNDERKRGGI